MVGNGATVDFKHTLATGWSMGWQSSLHEPVANFHKLESKYT